jgi:hypothetical protein
MQIQFPDQDSGLVRDLYCLPAFTYPFVRFTSPSPFLPQHATHLRLNLDYDGKYLSSNFPASCPVRSFSLVLMTFSKTAAL